MELEDTDYNWLIDKNEENQFLDTPKQEESAWSKLKKNTKSKFEDPNFIQALAQIGMGLDPKGVGGAVGNAAYNWSKNEAAQKAGAKQSTGQMREMDRFIKSIQGDIGNKLIGDPEDMETANKITMDHKGINVSYPNKSPRPKYSFADEGAGLGNIKSFEGYDGLNEDDLRGVDPESLKTLLAGDERFRSNIFETGMNEIKYGREKEAAKRLAIAKAKENELEREFNNSDREDDQEATVNLQKIKDKEEMKRLKLKLTTGQPLTPSDQIAMQRLKLEVSKYGHDVKIDENKEERNKRNEEALDQQDIFDMTKTPEERSLNAAKYNKKYESNSVVYESDGVIPGPFNDEEPGPKTFNVPKDMTWKGKRITSKQIQEYAEKNNMSVQEVVTTLMQKYEEQKKGK